MSPPRYAFRRLALLALAAGIGAVLLALAWATLAPGGWTGWEVAILLCLLGNLPWAGLCAANALLGLGLLLFTRDAPAHVLPGFTRRPPPPRLDTAIAVCIRNEDMHAVLPPLGRLLDGLAAQGVLDRFQLWLLSDTQDPAIARTEAMALVAFRAQREDAARIHYRRRAHNAGFKAGNVMDFLHNHAGEAELMLCLDADSEMTAEAVLRLVHCMEADPRLAIVQQLIVGRPAIAAFPRLFQFGMRAGMRSWATGQAWWQGPQGPYWGHNAVIRIDPFRRHCRLDPLADGSPILSHDQVEAVRLHAAGWKVMCLPEEEGSLEGNPPALPEFMARDRRWAAGNMQYWALLRLPGMTWMGRWQLVQAILLFLGAPLWAAVLALAAANALTGGAATTPDGPLLALLVATVLALSAPKLAGYTEAMLKPRLAARYGGRWRFALGAVAELAFTAVLAPAGTFNRALALLALPFGRHRGWAPQNRAERGIRGRDALRLLWLHTLFGAAVTAALAWGAPGALPWALPFTAGLLLVVPFCVLTASPAVSRFLQRRHVAATPEELVECRLGQCICHSEQVRERVAA